MSLSGCSRYLDIKPYGVTVPKTPEEFSALLQYHLNFIDEGRDMYLVGNTSNSLFMDMYADDFESALYTTSTNLLPISIKGELEINYSRTTPYQTLYQIIRDCNIVISELGNDGSDLARTIYGTAYGMRSVAYYQLMRLYCEAPEAGRFSSQKGLPIVQVYDIEAQIPRSDLQSLINFIESDFDKALSYNVTDASYYFTAEVIKGYKARLYHWTQQWEKAHELSKELLAAHPLLHASAFAEMIKETSHKGNYLIRNPRLIYDLNDDNRIELLSTRPLSRRYTALYSGETEKDIRAKIYFDTRRIVKRSVSAGLRSAELALILAEALYHMGQEAQALEVINDFRAHRIEGHTPYTSATLPEASPLEYIKKDAMGRDVTPLLSLILSERRKEFLLEGDRFFELKRNGSPEFWKAYNGERYDMLKFMYTLPIPLRDIALQESLEQNPEYENFTLGR